MFRFYRVRGDSMAPDYCSGDTVLVLTRRWGRCSRQGDVIIARHAEFGVILKQVQDVAADGALRLAGLSALSSAPEYLTVRNSRDVIGRVVWRWRRDRSSRLVEQL